MTLDKLGSSLARFRNARITVIGDLMLDEYVWGDVTRISPDAPVQVVDVRQRSFAIGGAGNVAHNLATAGASVDLVGVIGGDSPGASVSELLSAAGVRTDGVAVEKARATTVKTRIVARGQHLLRLDHEVRTSISSATRAAMIASLEKTAPASAAVVVSDYAKGVVDTGLLGEIATMLQRAGSKAPIIVDPKSSDFGGYAGCFAITPNQREAEIASRLPIRTDEDLRKAGRHIHETTGAAWVLITRGEKGMALVGADGSMVLIGADAREVYDVTGAGDTVLAYFSLALAVGLQPLDAARISNLAAGIKIGKVGTAAVGPAELLAWQSGTRGASKLMGLAEAVARLEHERTLGRRIVFTNGCFDLLHAGHIHLLEQARALGDYLVVAVNSDASVKQLKGEGRPFVGESDRVQILAALDAVDMVLVFEEATPLEIIRRIRPDVLVKGGDYSTETIVGHEFVLGYGGRVETVPLVGGRSTSRLIESIRKTGDP